MSTFFENLFEKIPSAKELLDSDPKNLAGHFLLSIVQQDSIKPNELIAHSSMSNVINRLKLIDRYPSEDHDDMIYALMEAWQYLKTSCYVAIRPSSLSTSHTIYSSPTYFVTRLGKSIESYEHYGSLIS